MADNVGKFIPVIVGLALVIGSVYVLVSSGGENMDLVTSDVAEKSKKATAATPTDLPENLPRTAMKIDQEEVRDIRNAEAQEAMEKMGEMADKAVGAMKETVKSMNDVLINVAVRDAEKELRLSAPQPVRIMKGGVRTLVVSGFVTNLEGNTQSVPNIKLMLLDKDDNIIQEASISLESSVIEPNSTVPYRFELQNPVESSTSLRVDFDQN